MCRYWSLNSEPYSSSTESPGPRSEAMSLTLVRDFQGAFSLVPALASSPCADDT